MNNTLIRIIFFIGLFSIVWVSCQKKEDNSDQVLVKKIVNQILEARLANTSIQPISKTSEKISLDEAYEIQKRLSKELSKSHGPIVGYKLGYSDSSSLQKNNICVPAYGPIFKSQIKKSGETVPVGDFRYFSIENEIVFTIAKTIDQKLNSIDELVSFVKSVHIGFDMSESIFEGPTTIVDFVADGAGSKYFFIGEGLDPVNTDIADVTLAVMINDSVVYKGTSKNVLGNPWFALREIANDLVERGYPLKRGDVVFSGKVAPAYKMQSDKSEGIYKGIACPFTDIHVLVK